MNKLLSLVFVLVISCVSSAHAMPVVALASAQTELAVQVGSGCGLGVRRGPFNGCDPVYVYDGNGNGAFHRAYWRGFYRGYRQGHYRGYRHAKYPYVRRPNVTGVVIVDRGICGFGSYLVCAYGTCWRRCY
jgi:hypothetical protein